MNKNPAKPVLTAVLSTLLFSASVSAITVNTAIQHSLAGSPDIRTQTNELAARKQEVEQAKAGYKPTIDINAAYGWDWNDNTSTRGAGFDDGRDLMRTDASITLSQMLFDGNATGSEVSRQEARLESMQRRIDGTSERLALDSVKAYLDVMMNRELVDLSESNLKSHERVYSQIELRREAGVGSQVDLEQVGGRRASANASRLADVVNLKDVETNYLAVTATLAPLDMEPVPSVANSLPASIEEAMQIALAQHPILSSAEADIKAAVAQKDAAIGDDAPRFNLELGGNWGDNQNGLEGDNSELSAMVRMRYNLFSGGRTKARKAQTAHLVNAAKEVRNQTFRQVVESLRLSWAAYLVTNAQLGSLEEYVDSTVATKRAYAKQFNIGKRTLVDVLNIESELFDAKRSLLEATYANRYAQYRILSGMGGLVNQVQAQGSIGYEGREDNGVKWRSVLANGDFDATDFAPEMKVETVEIKSFVADPKVVEAINVAVGAWAASWSAGEVENYLAHYANSFRSKRFTSRSRWVNNRRKVITGAKNITVAVENLTTAIDANGKTATANFTQRYTANNYKDVVTKTLNFRNEDGKWLITAENSK